MRKVFVFALAMALLSSCARYVNDDFDVEFQEQSEAHVTLLSWVLSANPDEDFEKAIDKGDLRFRGIYGINNPIPGIKRECIDVEKDVLYIKGTSEVLLGYEHAKLNAVAREYASYYNLRMLAYLRKNNGFKCIS